MKIVFVNRFFFPDISATSQMVSDLAFQLAAGGAEVYIVTSRLRYDDPAVKLPAHEVIGGVTIHRVWTSRFGRQSTLSRLCDYVTFYLTAPLKVLLLAARGDVVVVKTDPPMISVPVMIAARLRGARLANWLQDLFPEVAMALGMKLGGVLGSSVLTWIRNRSLRAADANVVLGSRMKTLVARHAPRVPVRVVPNWSPTADIAPLPRAANPLATQWQMADRFIVGYSGNLGRAHELDIVLDAAERLRHRLEIFFLIIGEGNQKERLQQEVTRRGLANVLFKPYQPKEQLKFSLTLPDVHLVSLKPALEGLIVPSKFYSSIAAGRPVVFIGGTDGEIAREVARGQCGVTVWPDDPVQLAKAIAWLCDDAAACACMGANARAMFEAEYSQAIAIGKWRAVLKEVQSS
jgi:colanic acid biosynthesis glycosyl transferase WcaI